jgi:hypothetical protein
MWGVHIDHPTLVWQSRGEANSSVGGVVDRLIGAEEVQGEALGLLSIDDRAADPETAADFGLLEAIRAQRRCFSLGNQFIGRQTEREIECGPIWSDHPTRMAAAGRVGDPLLRPVMYR